MPCRSHSAPRKPLCADSGEVSRADGRLSGAAAMDESVQRRVERLIAHYVEVIDQDRLEEWPELFTETCRYLVTSAESYEENAAASRDLRRLCAPCCATAYPHCATPTSTKRSVIATSSADLGRACARRRRRGALTLPRRAHHARRRRHAVRLRRLSRPH